MPKTNVLYPGGRQKCDLCLGDDFQWAIEIKMARLRGDNGKPDDMAIKDILSPFEIDRSALTDCSKLVKSNLAANSAILIYGFEDFSRPLEALIKAFERLASARVTLGDRISSTPFDLIHPVFRTGKVFAWEVSALSD